jgi:hypothetical protein
MFQVDDIILAKILSYPSFLQGNSLLIDFAIPMLVD